MHSLSGVGVNQPGHWLLVDLQYFSLLLPGRDSLTLVPLESGAQPRRSICALASHEHQQYPVFALDPALRLQAQAGEQCRLALLLHTDESTFGIACKNVTRLEDPLPDTHRLPACMASRRLPYREFVLWEPALADDTRERVAAITDALALLKLLQQQGADTRADIEGAAQRGAG